jgi:hypothetical protein
MCGVTAAQNYQFTQALILKRQPGETLCESRAFLLDGRLEIEPSYGQNSLINLFL